MDSAKHTENIQTAVILFAHGSSVEGANRGVHELAQRVEAAGPYRYVRAAFLGLAQPDLARAITEAVTSGARRIIVIPYFLTMGVHLREDLPGLVAAEKRKHPQAEIQVGKSLENHPEMASLILGRILEATEETKVAP